MENIMLMHTNVLQVYSIFVSIVEHYRYTPDIRLH